MAIIRTLFPGSSFGATLVFNYSGPIITVWVGIGLAYGQVTGHNPPFTYAMKQITLSESGHYEVSVSGSVPTNAQVGKFLDAQRFISDSQPNVGQQPPNSYGVNNWDDEIYDIEAVKEAFSSFAVSYW